MKAMAIQVNQLEECIKFAQLERELVVKLTEMLEREKEHLKKLERIKTLCQQMQFLQHKHKFKTSEEMVKKQLLKYRYLMR